MLLVSVGFIYADGVTVTVPKGKTATFTFTTGKDYKVTVNGEESKSPFTVKAEDTKEGDKDFKILGVTESLKVAGSASKIVCDNAQLKNLEAPNVGLKELTLPASSSALESLDVSGNEGMKFPISTTQASALSKLQILKVQGLKDANVKSLNFSGFTALRYLDVRNNNLTSLAVNNNEKLTLFADGNSLTKIEGLSDKATVNWGTQTITASDFPVEKKAHTGIDMFDVFHANDIFFNLKNLEALKANKSKLSYVWHKKVNNAYQTASSNEAHALYSTNPELFIFATASGSEYTYINTETTYECVVTYDGKIKMAIQGIKISPAELKLSLGEGLKAAKVGSSVPLNDGAIVTQGDHILFSVAKEGYTLKTFKEVKGLTAKDKDQFTKNGGEFIVTGSVNKATPNEPTHPSIRAEFVGESCQVKTNLHADGGKIKLQAKYDNKTTDLTAETTTLFKGSELILTLTPDLGYAPKVEVNGQTYTSEKMKQDGNNFILTLSADQVVKDLQIHISFVQNKNVAVTLQVEGTTLAGGCFYGGFVKIGDKSYTNTTSGPQAIASGKTQISFALTKQAVTGSNANKTWNGSFKVADVRLNTTSLLKDATLNPVKNPKNDTDAALEYTVPVEIPSENATITIVLTKLETVNVVPEGGDNTQKQTYDGKPKAFKFKTAPANIKVEYKVQNQANALYSADVPTAAGTYLVKYSCPATGNYAAVENTEWTLQIEKATPAFEKVPTVTIDEKTGKYVISGGVVKFGAATLPGKYAIVEGEKPTGDNAKKSHLVTVEFTVNDGKSDDPNFNPANAQVAVKVGDEALAEYEVDLKLAEGITGKMFNGAKEVAAKTKVPAGTKLTIQLVIPVDVNASSVNLYTAKPSQTPVESFSKDAWDAATRTLTFTEIEVTEAVTYVVKASAHDVKNEYKVTMTKQEEKYDGKIKNFDVTKNMKIEGVTAFTEEQVTAIKKTVVISYKDQNGKAVEAPENVGLYTVCVKIPYNGNSTDYASYKEYVAEFKDYLEIKKGDVTVTWPTKSSMIAKGQTLAASELSGGNASVAGSFKWLNETVKPVSGQKYEIQFVPDNKNYDIVKSGTENAVVVYVSDKNLVTFVPQNCIVTVVNAETGAAFKTGDVVAKGTKLKITVQANESFVMKTFTVNGKVFTSGSTFTVADESVEIVAIAQLKQTNPTDVVLNLVCGTGAIASKPEGAYEVAFNSNFIFTVSTLDADKDKLTVKAGTETIKPDSKGVYTVKADKKKSIYISVLAPTAITVKADTTLSPGKKPMGKVEIQGWTATKKYYYGDEIIVTAFPESGVTFTGWKDITSKENPLTVTLTKASYVFKAQYKGVPTGIEAIEAAKIYGDKGCIVIRGIADAQVTIVSMDGRVQRAQVSGDSRIDMPAGIYGVVLDQDGDQKRVKVIVR